MTDKTRSYARTLRAVGDVMEQAIQRAEASGIIKTDTPSSEEAAAIEEEYARRRAAITGHDDPIITGNYGAALAIVALVIVGVAIGFAILR